jgi:hypothetical protein
MPLISSRAGATDAKDVLQRTYIEIYAGEVLACLGGYVTPAGDGGFGGDDAR